MSDRHGMREHQIASDKREYAVVIASRVVFRCDNPGAAVAFVRGSGGGTVYTLSRYQVSTNK